jgi:hypothetical protein
MYVSVQTEYTTSCSPPTRASDVTGCCASALPTDGRDLIAASPTAAKRPHVRKPLITPHVIADHAGYVLTSRSAPPGPSVMRTVGTRSCYTVAQSSASSFAKN